MAGKAVGSSIAEKAKASVSAPAKSANSNAESSEMCYECGAVRFGRVDDLDGNFYCDICWSVFMASAAGSFHQMAISVHASAQGIERENDYDAQFDFWGSSAVSPGPESLPKDGLWDGECAEKSRQQLLLFQWAHARVIELLSHNVETYVDADVVVGLLLALAWASRLMS